MPARPTPDRRTVPARPPQPRAVPLIRPATSLTRTIRARRPEATQGVLALQWQLPGELDAEPVPDVGLRLVPRLRAATDDTDPAVAEVPTSGAELPDPGPWTAQLVQAVLEVLGHERPRQQLVRWLTPEVYAELSAHVAATAARPAAGLAGRSRRTVSSVHLCEPADGVVEASVVVVGGPRVRALALRLEGWDGRWRCTRLALL